MVWYSYSFLELKLGSLFSPQLAEDLLAPAFFFPSFKEIHYFFCHCHHMARQRVCVTRRFDFSTAFTVDLLKHPWDQDRDLVGDEISNSQFFSCAFIFNSQNWISTRILRVCKHEFRALQPGEKCGRPPGIEPGTSCLPCGGSKSLTNWTSRADSPRVRHIGKRVPILNCVFKKLQNVFQQQS